MTRHLVGHRQGFGLGVTEITSGREAEHPTGIRLSVVRLKAGEIHEETVEGETAWLLMAGEAQITCGARSAELGRRSLFDEQPSCVHLATGTHLQIAARQDTEFTRFEVDNTKRFAPEIYEPKDVRNEGRGKGLVKNAALRYVRTIFDDSNAHPDSDLVLGEVINLPGRWSSYPPHHHPQPELYHYRFSHPAGYGHAELGEQVLKVHHNDTIKILDQNDHAQCAAPGYAMYYAWVIRHLPGQRYTVPEFTEAHSWTMNPDATFWWPRSEESG